MTTYYITKYTTTTGKIIVVNAAESPKDNGYVPLRLTGHHFPTGFYLGRDVFTDEAEARAAVIEARDKRIASLEKQIAKLRKVEPSIQ